LIHTSFDLGITHFDLAKKRGQSLAQMSISWVLRKKTVTSALIGVSKVNQIDDSLKALGNLKFSDEELRTIDNISLS
jgi:L-glyceraldehyde 3-phosphate reductase